MISSNERLSFLDIETTGLNPFYGDRICEIAVLACQGLKIEDEFCSLINPGRPISPDAYAVNGIGYDLVKNAPCFSDVRDKVFSLIKDRIIVCHNASFDLGFLEHELTRINIELPRILVIDTLNLARRFFNFSSNSLSDIASCLEIDLENAHRALGDARTTRKVLINFIPELRKRGVNALHEISLDWKTCRPSYR